MYMLELYRDNLIDLFGDHKNPAKLDIKKDKKVIRQKFSLLIWCLWFGVSLTYSIPGVRLSNSDVNVGLL